MAIVAIVVSVILSVFSTAVMSYISMATPIGPWIAPTLVLCAMLFFKLLRQHAGYSERIALVTIAGSVGGILATACGFSFPTLYFLDPVLFDAWMATPIYFAAVVSGLSFASGCFGLWIANMLEEPLIVQEQLSFPVGQLTHKMISAQNQIKKAWELMVGFVGTAIFCFLQDGLWAVRGIIAKSMVLIPAMKLGFLRVPVVSLDFWPLLWAIGFVTGHVIAVPLAVGALSKIIVIEPLNALLFPDISSMEFVLAFCSGLVLIGAAQGILKMPQTLYKAARNVFSGNKETAFTGSINMVETGLIAVFIIGFLTYFKFGVFAQVYLLFLTLICTYEMAYVAGKVGLAMLGRYATFVMVPALFIFNLSIVQIVFIAAFVEMCGGVTVDALFGRKLGRLSHINGQTVKRYQYLGLAVSALCIGAVFWLLINQFGLGTEQLYALKARNRELLINAHSFNYYVLALGILFGWLLKIIKVNPSLVLGGLLMPLNISLGLVIGGFATKLTKDPEEWYPLWSGIFAANSVWMLIKAIL